MVSWNVSQLSVFIVIVSFFFSRGYLRLAGKVKFLNNSGELYYLEISGKLNFLKIS
jgi:hypothetical protein